MSDPLRKRLLNPGFRYYRAAETDVARTFKRIRREQREADEQAKAQNVSPIKRKAP